MELGKNISAKFDEKLRNLLWDMVVKQVGVKIIQPIHFSTEDRVEEIAHWSISWEIDNQISVYDLD